MYFLCVLGTYYLKKRQPNIATKSHFENNKYEKAFKISMYIHTHKTI